jgi:hypothetical protein
MRTPREAAVMTKRSVDEGQMSMRQERMLGVVMLVAGLSIAGVAVSRMGPEAAVHAQATPTPSVPEAKPAESMPGGTRPTTPAPEPARPQNKEGSTTGIAPSGSGDRPPEIGTPLPSAPAEKTGKPIQPK